MESPLDENAALGRALEQWASCNLVSKLGSLGPVSITQVRRAQGGFSSDTLFVEARIDGGRRSAAWVLRIEARGHQVYQDPSVLRQYRMMEAIAAHSDIPVPACIAYESDPSVLGAPFFLMERIAGEVPPRYYHREGVWFDATPAQRERMWLASIEQMARLHALEPAPFSFLAYEGGPIADGIAQELMRWDSYLRWAALPAYTLLDRARLWLEDHRPARGAGGGVAWGDARPCNILYRDNGPVALLDWETASLGGGESDLGWWLAYEDMVTQEAGTPRLDGVGDRAATIAAWEGFAGRPARNMEWHEVFATYRFALISERAVALAIEAGHARQADRGEGNPAMRRLAQLIA